jgi:tetratricopeptide (TPR) repeat protein
MAALRSDYQLTVQMLLRSAGQLGAAGKPSAQAVATALAGRACAYLGDTGQALRHIEHSLQVTGAIQDPATTATVYMCRGAVYDQHGDWDRALADYAEAQRLAGQAGDLTRSYLIACQQGRAYALHSDPQRGHDILQQSLTLANKLDIAPVPAWPRVHLAACLLKLEQYDKVQPLCREALRLALAGGDYYGQFLAQRTLAEILTRMQPEQTAAIHTAMHEAIRLQRQLGALPELMRSYISYAGLLDSLGEQDDAAEYRNQALELFAQLDMAGNADDHMKHLPADQLVS